MAFPTAGTLDSFTRANEGPPMTGWTAWISSGLKVVSNKCAPNDTGGNAAYWSTAISGRDQEAYVTLDTLGDNTTFSAVAARIDPSGGGTIGNCYHFNHTVVSSGTDTVKLERVDSTVGTVIWGPVEQDLAAGDAIGIRCEGSTIEAWARISGTWTLLGSAIDSTYSGDSPNVYIGLYNDNGSTTDARYDDFGGGVADYILIAANSGAAALTATANSGAAALTTSANSGAAALTNTATSGADALTNTATSGADALTLTAV